MIPIAARLRAKRVAVGRKNLISYKYILSVPSNCGNVHFIVLRTSFFKLRP